MKKYEKNMLLACYLIIIYIYIYIYIYYIYAYIVCIVYIYVHLIMCIVISKFLIYHEVSPSYHWLSVGMLSMS